MHYNSCVLNARKGDEVELLLPSEDHRNRDADIREKYEVVGVYYLNTSMTAVPVLGIPSNPNPRLQSYYYPSDVLKDSKGFPFPYCIPMHDHCLDYAVTKIYKKTK